MGYFEDQAAAARKRIGDAIAGKALRENIRQLQDKAKVRNSLKDAPVRGDLTSRKKIGKRVNSGGGTGGGLKSPFTEVEKTRTFHETERQFWSSDGLFVFAYYNTKQITTRDGYSTEVLFIYDDYQTP